MIVANNLIFGRKYDSLSTNLVAYYAFENNVVDSVNGNNGTYISPLYPTGIIGKGSQYGASRYITVPNSTNLDFSNGTNDLPFSVSFWYSKVDAASRAIFSKRGGNALNDQYEIDVAGSSIGIYLYSNSTSAYLLKRTTTFIPNNVFIHYTITYDGSGTLAGLKMYLNSVLETTADTTVGVYTTMPISNQLEYLGRLWNGTKTLAGIVDELAIWKNRELNQQDVNQLYNSGLGITYPLN